MSSSWIKFDLDTFDKPEVLAIAAALDLPQDHVVGCLLRIWGWFDRHTEDGRLPANASLTLVRYLDRVCNVQGMAKAMQDVGWLCVKDDVLSVPNFDRHNGKTAKKRALTARRVADHAARKTTNALLTLDALPREEKIYKENLVTNVTSQKKKRTAPKTRAHRFAKPTPQQVTDYARTIGFDLDGQQFTDYYESRGWSVGSGKMRDWRAAVRTWKRRRDETGGGAHGGNGKHRSDAYADFERRVIAEALDGGDLSEDSPALPGAVGSTSKH